MEQADKLTLETQQTAIQNACESRGWRLRRRNPFFIDEAEHSDDLKRRWLSRLLEEVENGKIGRIVVYMHDRLARGELLKVLLQFLMSYDVKVFFLDLPEFNDSTEMLYDNIASQGKYFLKMLRKRTAEGVATAISKGHKAGRPPAGFTVKNKTEWVPKELSLEIERLHREGMSAVEMRNMGFVYPDGRRKGKPVTLTHVKRVLKRMALWREGELANYLLESKGPRKEEFLELLKERSETRRDAIAELQARIPVKIERRSL